jgi:hypothetical protein
LEALTFSDDKIYGIELLNAKDQLQSQNNELIFIDVAIFKAPILP